MARTFPVVRAGSHFAVKTQRAVKCISSHLYHWELDPHLMKAWKNVREYCSVHCSEMRTFFSLLNTIVQNSAQSIWWHNDKTVKSEQSVQVNELINHLLHILTFLAAQVWLCCKASVLGILSCWIWIIRLVTNLLVSKGVTCHPCVPLRHQESQVEAHRSH